MKKYIEPTTTIVEMKHKEKLMIGSEETQQMTGSRKSYGPANTDEWE